MFIQPQQEVKLQVATCELVLEHGSEGEGEVAHLAQPAEVDGCHSHQEAAEGQQQQQHKG